MTSTRHTHFNEPNTNLSLLGSTAQFRPWPPFFFFEASQQFSFLQGRVVSPKPNPQPGGPGLCIYIPQRHSVSIWKPIVTKEVLGHHIESAWSKWYKACTSRPTCFILDVPSQWDLPSSGGWQPLANSNDTRYLALFKETSWSEEKLQG